MAHLNVLSHDSCLGCVVLVFISVVLKIASVAVMVGSRVNRATHRYDCCSQS